MNYNSGEMQNYFSLFVGEKKFDAYYKQKWENKYNREWFISFNISAFLMPFIWLFYRKMNMEGAFF